MSKKSGSQLQKHLAQVFAEKYRYRFSQREALQIETLIDLYYRYVTALDLKDEKSADLIGATIAHWQLLKEGRGRKPMVRVYNPTFEEHGWQSPHTVVEVVSDDMAFLVDSLTMGLNRAGLTIFLTIHPVVSVTRNRAGELRSLDDQPAQGKATSMICFRIEKQLSADVLRALDVMIREVLKDVIRTNSDWLEMRQRVHAIGERTAAGSLPVAEDELSEAGAFLQWLERDHFTFLAYCEFDLKSDGPELSVNQDSLLGLFSENRSDNHDPCNVIPVLGDQMPQFPGYLLVTKSNARSAVHRPAYMDFIGIRRYNDRGELDGLYCIVGLFALAAYSSPPKDIPLLRKKVAEVEEAAGLAATSRTIQSQCSHCREQHNL